MNPNRSQHSALTEIESRISVLERRLKNAKSARNSYVDYLRGKYPAWKPSLPSYHKRMNRDDHLLGHLATSSYHWEGFRHPIIRPAPPPAQFYSEIPRRYEHCFIDGMSVKCSDFMDSRGQTSHYCRKQYGGPFLESDFARTRERLGIMSQQLRLLRDARMNMSTEDYFRSRSVRMRDEYYEEDEVPSLDGVRKRLADMTFSLLEPPSTPTMERIEEMKRLEAREKLIIDIRSGVLPSVTDTIERPRVEEPVKEKTPVEIPMAAEATAVSQARIQFADNKPVPVVTAPVPTMPISSAVAAPKEPEQANAYSRIMGLLNRNDSDDSEDIQMTRPAVAATPSQPKSSEPQLVLGSLSQYLNKGPSSSTKPMFAGYTGGSSKKEESDSDDFFD